MVAKPNGAMRVGTPDTSCPMWRVVSDVDAAGGNGTDLSPSRVVGGVVKDHDVF